LVSPTTTAPTEDITTAVTMAKIAVNFIVGWMRFDCERDKKEKDILACIFAF